MIYNIPEAMRRYNKGFLKLKGANLTRVKSWGIIRGRSDHWLFSSNEMFESALDAVWGFTIIKWMDAH